jgi:hypothetical protein
MSKGTFIPFIGNVMEEKSCVSILELPAGA